MHEEKISTCCAPLHRVSTPPTHQKIRSQLLRNHFEEMVLLLLSHLVQIASLNQDEVVEARRINIKVGPTNQPTTNHNAEREQEVIDNIPGARKCFILLQGY